MSRALALLWLVGCAEVEPTDRWLVGFGYGWGAFNHRTSHVAFRPVGGEVGVAIVGGTSTTGVAPELPATCDPTSCAEFPVTDAADVSVRYGSTSAAGVRTAVGTATLVTGADGATATATAEFGGRVSGQIIAVITGFSLDTDHAVDGEPGCYDPKSGWHPRVISLAVGPAGLDGTTVTADVTAAFAAGNSLEPERACIDLVAAHAVVDVAVDVLFVAANADVATVDLSSNGAWELGNKGAPVVQEPPEPTPLGLPYASPIAGWTSLEWRFHVDDPELRGAYLRTLHADLDPAAGTVAAWATNYSPGTQLSGFDYAFTGRIAAVDVPAIYGEIGVDAVPAAFDAEGEPVVTTLALP